jgi:glycosyltransferase involved in cell wall biosynthesis
MIALSNSYSNSSATDAAFGTTALSGLPPFKAKVIHVVASIVDEASGLSYSVPRLCQELSETGHSITLMSIGDADQTSQDSYRMERCPQTFANVPIVRKLQRSQTMRRKLHEQAREHCVLHAHGLWVMPNIYPAIVARRYHIPLIVAPRGMLGREALKFSRYRKYLMWYAAQRSAVAAASCLHATSEQEYLEIRNFGLRQPVAVVPNGVDVPPMSSGVRKQQHTVLYLGRIHPKKGLDRLISAWRSLENDWPDWRLEIIGPDERGYLDELKRQARDLGLRRVSFADPVFGNRKHEAYRAADLFVMPTLNENFAMTVAEALSNGTPVICTKGAPWQGLEINRCGWWIDQGKDALTCGLREAMSKTHDELVAMGLRGRAWMIKDFSWRSIALEMSSVYRWLSGEGSAPHCVRLG